MLRLEAIGIHMPFKIDSTLNRFAHLAGNHKVFYEMNKVSF
jgi:hypothetical protein